MEGQPTPPATQLPVDLVLEVHRPISGPHASLAPNCDRVSVSKTASAYESADGVKKFWGIISPPPSSTRHLSGSLRSSLHRTRGVSLAVAQGGLCPACVEAAPGILICT